MRLKTEKIDQISQLIFESLSANDRVKINEDSGVIINLVRQVITADLKAEDDIEEEARSLLEGHMDTIRAKSVSFDSLLRKTKQKIANERKMVL
jgi:hypothetical protein